MGGGGGVMEGSPKGREVENMCVWERGLHRIWEETTR